MNGNRGGRLIVLEGPDGAGKSTLARACQTHLAEAGESAVLLSFPGREAGTLGKHIYALHHDPRLFGIAEMTPESLQALHVAAHLDAIDRLIRPRIIRGQTVVLDRYWWSTWVYGVAAGAKEATLTALVECERQHWATLVPDVVILITRSDSLRTDDAGEPWTRRLGLYLELSDRECKHHPVRVVNNDSDEATAVRTIVETVETLRAYPPRSGGTGRPSTPSPIA